MTDTNMSLLAAARPAGTLAPTDKYLTRQGADTEDRAGTLQQLADWLRTFIYSAIGQGVSIKTGTNSRALNATLAAGTVTVSNSSCTANTEMQITQKGTQTSPGTLSYVVTAGVGFTVTSSNVAHAGAIHCTLIELIP